MIYVYAENQPMKSKLIQSGTVLCAAIMLASCSIHKSSIVSREKDAQQSRDTESSCFVQWKDGTFSIFESLKLVTGMFKTPMLLADGEIKIYPDQIRAYQNDKHYAISQSEFATVRKTYVSSETLPGFAVRIARGKFNLYAKKMHNGQHTADEYYLQEGDKGKIFACSNDIMNELMQKDPESFDMVYAKMSRTMNQKKMQSMASLARTNQSLTKNK